jgi:hypothetical protein
MTAASERAVTSSAAAGGILARIYGKGPTHTPKFGGSSDDAWHF